MKTLKISTNKANKRYALTQDKDGFAVYAECANYASHIKGGIAYTWRYVKRGLPQSEAEALFTKRINGKAR